MSDEVGELAATEAELEAAHEREIAKLADQKTVEETEMEMAKKKEEADLQAVATKQRNVKKHY